MFVAKSLWSAFAERPDVSSLAIVDGYDVWRKTFGYDMAARYRYAVYLTKAGEFVFGCFVSETFRTDGAPFGSPRAFLFSLTLDLKLPYHGATAPPPLDGATAAPPHKAKKHGCIRAADTKIAFGASDFVIDESLNTCASTLEGSFGVGLDPDDADALLAGAKTFAVDHLEIWSVAS